MLNFNDLKENFYGLLLVLLILSLMLVLTSTANAQYTGKDMVCDKIGYLSTECKDANIVPYELKDREIALEKAKSGASSNYENNYQVHINIKKVTKESKDKKAILVKSWFEKAGK